MSKKKMREEREMLWFCCSETHEPTSSPAAFPENNYISDKHSNATTTHTHTHTGGLWV